MAKKFKTLREKMSPEAQKRAKEGTALMLKGMPLSELRKARALSQETLSQTMDVKQPEISKLEKRTDAYISTLRRYIEAMGGSLKITAQFPEGNVEITQFKDIDVEEEPTINNIPAKISGHTIARQ
jgi:transcriptional regulator with XRE-family HTH domain